MFYVEKLAVHVGLMIASMEVSIRKPGVEKLELQIVFALIQKSSKASACGLPTSVGSR